MNPPPRQREALPFGLRLRIKNQEPFSTNLGQQRPPGGGQSGPATPRPRTENECAGALGGRSARGGLCSKIQYRSVSIGLDRSSSVSAVSIGLDRFGRYQYVSVGVDRSRSVSIGLGLAPTLQKPIETDRGQSGATETDRARPRPTETSRNRSKLSETGRGRSGRIGADRYRSGPIAPPPDWQAPPWTHPATRDAGRARERIWRGPSLGHPVKLQRQWRCLGSRRLLGNRRLHPEAPRNSPAMEQNMKSNLASQKMQASLVGDTCALPNPLLGTPARYRFSCWGNSRGRVGCIPRPYQAPHPPSWRCHSASRVRAPDLRSGVRRQGPRVGEVARGSPPPIRSPR